MAKWESKELAASPAITAIGEQATAAIEGVAAVMEIIAGGAEVAKLFLSGFANPLALALALLADEIIKALNDYKNLGFFALVINPFDETYGAKQQATYGLEMVRDDNGNPYFKESQVMNPDSPFDGLTYNVNEAYREQIDIKVLEDQFGTSPWRDRIGRTKEMKGFVPPTPIITSPPKFILGGYDPATWTGTIETVDPFPSLPAPECLKLMSDAFDDEGDIAKYEIINKTDPINKGPFTESGGAISSFDPLNDYKFHLYKSDDTSLTPEERGQITRQIQTGRPSYEGSENTSGLKVSALAIVVAAADFKEFIDGFKGLAGFLGPGVPDLSKVLTALEDMFSPEPIALTIEVNSKYGLFAAGDYIKGDDSGAIGKIEKIASSSPSIRTKTVYSLQNDQFGDLSKIVKEELNMNAEGIWQDVKLEYVPLDDLTNRFIPGEKVYQAEVLSKNMPDGKAVKLYNIKGSQFKNNVLGLAAEAAILPKYGYLKGIDATAPNSTPPDFFSMKASEMVPGYADFFDGLIEMANGLKGFAVDTSAFIQSLIDVIDDLLEFFEDLAAKITTFLEFFTKGLPSAGVYMLGITTTAGNDAIKDALTGSDNSPGDDLKYSAGVLLMSVEINGIDPLAVFGKSLLGLDFESV